MEKELFYTLQEIKGIINKLNYTIPGYDEVIQTHAQNALDTFEELENCRKDMKQEDKDYVLTNLVTLGKYRKQNKFHHMQQKAKLMLTESHYLRVVDIYEEEIKKQKEAKVADENRKEAYIKNREQIDSFLELCGTLTDEEKEKVFNYKMGIRSKHDEELMAIQDRISIVSLELEEMQNFLKENPRELALNLTIQSLRKISIALLEISCALFILANKPDYNVISFLLCFFALKNIVESVKKRVLHLYAETGYKIYDQAIKELSIEKDKLLMASEFLKTPNEEEKDKYLSYKIKED